MGDVVGAIATAGKDRLIMARITQTERKRLQSKVLAVVFLVLGNLQSKVPALPHHY
ncbi:hypothetical protein [Nostoc sp.]|uniref:hypothetical protein n=1 Tax=Nostoc sp. TaxID=1180 RepID=UPI003FA5E055